MVIDLPLETEQLVLRDFVEDDWQAVQFMLPTRWWCGICPGDRILRKRHRSFCGRRWLHRGRVPELPSNLP